MRAAPHELARRLGEHAEAVCRRYLSNGRRCGNYWIVGDVRNTPGRSMYVRLRASAKGAPGRWCDAATGEHGDLLDIIRATLGLSRFEDIVNEARSFLALPHPESAVRSTVRPAALAPAGSPEAARRLFAISQPIAGTIAETYLRTRGIVALRDVEALRFHPRCYYRPDHGPTEAWPAMIAAVTDHEGRQTGAHRTWLANDGSGKAPVDTPRRSMGDLLGHAVRFGSPDGVMAAGEGIETTLSLRCALPGLASVAALSAAHLAALRLPPALRRLYVILDRDPAGGNARDLLVGRARDLGIDAIVLTPQMGDFNEDLRQLGLSTLRATVIDQLRRRDRLRWLNQPE